MVLVGTFSEAPFRSLSILSLANTTAKSAPPGDPVHRGTLPLALAMTPGNWRLQLNCKTYHMSGGEGELVTRYMLMWGWEGCAAGPGLICEIIHYSC